MVKYFNLTSDSKKNYSDVDPSEWYASYVAIAKANGMLPDIYGDTFEPNKKITRQDMMYILHRSLEVSNKDSRLADKGDRLDSFTDSTQLADYARNSAEYLISRDIINGSNNMINPNNTSTRAEVAQMLYNLLISFLK